MVRCAKIFALTMMLVLGAQASSFALTNEEVFSQFQFNFITPGARATALGGAFIGLADDATAVESNPAGLTQLAAPEVSAEFKYLQYTTEQILENYEKYTEIRRMEFEDSVVSTPFLSIVYPVKRFVFSLYRQELLNYKSAYRTGASLIRIPGKDSGGLYPIDASVELNIINYGIGAAVEILEDKLSFAVSPRWSFMNMESRSSRFYSTSVELENGTSWFLPTDFSLSDLLNETTIDDEDNGFSINAGVMWKLHPKISIGAVYRSGTEFTVKETVGRVSSPYIVNPDSPIFDADVAKFTLKVPDTFGAGIAFRLSDFLTCTLDVVHIRYEDLLEDFDLVFPQDVTKDEYTIDNATELHFGVEYIIPLGERLLALRTGVYNEPDHTIRYTGQDAGTRELFPGGDDQIHVTGGIGFVVNEHLQIDTAGNFSDNTQQFSISAVYRF